MPERPHPSGSGRTPRRLGRVFLGGALGGLLLVLAAGCAGYRLGPTNGMAAGARSIEVTLFQNLTPEPRLSEAVAQALRKRLQQDGSFRLATRHDGDILVTGVIHRFERSPVSFQPRDVITPRDMEVYLVARITAQERATGKKLLDRDVRGRTIVRVGAELAAAEFQAVPLLAEDLARNATSLLVDGAW